MIIAVIGDYGSQEYSELVGRIRMVKPEEIVIDLSKHNSGSWIKDMRSRFRDIGNSHQLVISRHWQDYLEAKRDITHALSLHKECFIERDGQFLPFPQYAEKI